MSEIKRYELYTDGFDNFRMKEVPNGEFVRFEDFDNQRAAALIVGKLSALIPLKDTIAATKNGQTFVDYFSSALTARSLFDGLEREKQKIVADYEKQTALIKNMVAAFRDLSELTESGDDPIGYVREIANEALAAAKSEGFDQ